MSKLLFVEDDLTPDRILNLFDKYLSNEEKEILVSRKVKTSRDIKSLLDKNPCIHVEYNFIDAINTIDSSFDDFSFFIIDRNLYAPAHLEDFKPAYNLADVPKLIDAKIVPKWEGDYLFLLLLDKYWKYSNPRLLLENFYFLTAYSAEKESLKIEDSLGKLFLFFPPNHVIEKDITDMVGDFVENKINKFKDLVIKSEHREVFEIFSKGYLDSNLENDLLNILTSIEEQGSSEIKKKVNLLRDIFQEILRKIIKIDTINKELPKKYHQSGNLDVPKILTFLNGMPTKMNNWNPTTTEYFSNCSNLLSDYGLWKVSSEIAHGGKSGVRKLKYTPTRYTMKILVNILLDFLIWFGDFMDKNK